MLVNEYIAVFEFLPMFNYRMIIRWIILWLMLEEDVYKIIPSINLKKSHIIVVKHNISEGKISIARECEFHCCAMGSFREKCRPWPSQIKLKLVQIFGMLFSIVLSLNACSWPVNLSCCQKNRDSMNWKCFRVNSAAINVIVRPLLVGYLKTDKKLKNEIWT